MIASPRRLRNICLFADSTESELETYNGDENGEDSILNNYDIDDWVNYFGGQEAYQVNDKKIRSPVNLICNDILTEVRIVLTQSNGNISFVIP